MFVEQMFYTKFVITFFQTEVFLTFFVPDISYAYNFIGTYCIPQNRDKSDAPEKNTNKVQQTFF